MGKEKIKFTKGIEHGQIIYKYLPVYDDDDDDDDDDYYYYYTFPLLSEHLLNS